MKYKLIILYLFLSTIFFGSFCKAQDTSIVQGNILVMLESGDAIQRILNNYSQLAGLPTNLQVDAVLSTGMHIYLLKFDTTIISTSDFLSLLHANPFVKIAQYNHKISWRSTTDDSMFSDQWSLENTGQSGGTAGVDIDAINAWEVTTGGLTSQGDTIVVAVIDGGFDLTHDDLNYWKNHHEIPNNSIDDDGNGYIDDYDGWNDLTSNDDLPVQAHGTHVSGIIGAKGNNGLGITGINWNVKVMPVSSDGNTEADVVASYIYVLEQRRLYNQTSGAKGAFVVATNSSFGVDLGQPASFPLWCAMYDSLGSVGILSVAATTNSNVNVDTQGDIPTACGSNWLVTVTNTTNTDAKANAGYGLTTIDLGAPGSSILSTVVSNSYQGKSGTSQATPHVAGAIALMYSVNCPGFMVDYKSNSDSMALIIKDSLLATTDAITALNNITVTGGRLNLNKAVNAIVNLYSNESCIPDVPKEDIPVLSIAKIYPVPVYDKLYIDYYAQKEARLQIFNVLGELLKELTLPADDELAGFIVDVKALSLSNGMYLLRLKNEDTTTPAVKVVVY